VPRQHRSSRNRLRGSGSDFSDIANLVADLGQLTPEMRKAMRAQMLRAGKGALTDAKSKASWSSRIPGAISLGVRTNANNVGVFLRVNADKAPHARPFEGITDRRATFRHPVFGDREVWVEQTTRPFLAPAVQDAKPAVMTGLRAAVQDAARAANFR